MPGPGRFMVVAVRTAPSFTFTSPVAVPRGFGGAPPGAPRTFDIMPDGRIVGVVTAGQSQSGSPATGADSSRAELDGRAEASGADAVRLVAASARETR